MSDESTMPPGSVIITPSQMYAEIRVMSGKVDHLASVIDPALSNLREDVAAVRTVQTDHESRLRSLDKRMWIAAILAAASGAGISQLLPFIGG